MAENLDNEISLVRIEDLRYCLIAAFERLELPHEDAEQVAEVLLVSPTLRVPKYDIGAEAARMLLDRIAGRYDQTEVVIKPELVLRSSAP